MPILNVFESDRIASDQVCHDKFQEALVSWKDASRDLDKWAGDDQEMIGLCSKVSTAVDVLLATPAPNIAGVLAKLDSMWKGGGEWSKDQTHRGQIVVDLESFTVRFSDMRPPVVY